MLWAAQNRCGVFAGIGTMLTGRKKTAIAWQPAVGGSFGITLFRRRVLACDTMYYFINYLFYYKIPW